MQRRWVATMWMRCWRNGRPGYGGGQAQSGRGCRGVGGCREDRLCRGQAGQPRKVLIYSHCNGFPHTGGIAAAKVALAAIGKKTGAFECVISDDLANFEADKIQQFDAIFFNNTTGDLFTGKAFDSAPSGRPRKRKPRRPSGSATTWSSSSRAARGSWAITERPIARTAGRPGAK